MNLPSWLRAVLNFNDFYRDRFIAEVARTVPPGARMLDAGAGPCRYKPLFAHCDYRAQDFCKYEGQEHRYGELDYVGDITHVPEPDGYFDFILCTEVFEHLPRPDLAVQEFSRLLRKGGEAVITAPLASGIHMAPYHFYGGFSPYWYRHFLPAHGFEIEFIRHNGGFYKLYGQESRRFVARLTPRSRLARLLFLPVKIVLGVWFSLLLPIICHVLDALEKEPEFTAGYFVRMRKI
jgi:SAM-dependent methyltransferase